MVWIYFFTLFYAFLLVRIRDSNRPIPAMVSRSQVAGSGTDERFVEEVSGPPGRGLMVTLLPAPMVSVFWVMDVAINSVPITPETVVLPVPVS